MKAKRTQKLIDPKLQLKVVSLFVTILSFCAAFQYFLFHHSVLDIVSGPHSSQRMTGELLTAAWSNMWLTLGLLAPLTISVGVLMTFRIAGPAYAMERYLRAVAMGEDPGLCRVRKHDELASLCDAVNDAMRTLRAGQNVPAGTQEAAPSEQAAEAPPSPNAGVNDEDHDSESTRESECVV